MHTYFSVSCVLCTQTLVCLVFCAHILQCVLCSVHTDFSVSCVLCTHTSVCLVFCAHRRQRVLCSVHTYFSVSCVLCTQTLVCLVFCSHRLQFFNFTISVSHGNVVFLILVGKFSNIISITPEAVAKKLFIETDDRE